MTQISNHHRQHDIDPALDLAGQHLAQRLLDSVDNIDSYTLQRLRAAREQAVDFRRNVLVQEAQARLAVASHAESDQTLSLHDRPSKWQQFSGIGMLMALLLGLWMIDTIQSDNFTQDAAEIDNVLLTDDLPPAAYLDPGFKHFLKLSYPSETL
ncbi:MAG: hypothetical protein FD135_3404 [Comamonadaceae bacterium]|nr:MAG: hypothetical protein FD135_3404 [Comamonadaceae bacterium]